MRFFEQTLERWKRRNLTIFGRILILKSLALSKFVYNFNVLIPPDHVVKELKKLMFKFIWNGTERIKRSVLIGSLEQGGLKMIDIECFIMSLQAAWVTRLLREDECKNIFINYYAGKLGLSVKYLFLSNITNDKHANASFLTIPDFYRHVIYSFNQVKIMKNISRMNTYDLLTQMLWHNRLFCFKDITLSYRHWMKSGFIFVYDMLDCNGNVKGCDEILGQLTIKSNWISEYTIIKSVLQQIISKININTHMISAINRVKIQPQKIYTVEGIVTVDNQTSRFYYNCLVRQKFEKPNVITFWKRKYDMQSFHFKHIFTSKVLQVSDIKIREFNYKVLHRILPCGSYLSKWKPNISANCHFCEQIETIEHLIFNCPRIFSLWRAISVICKVNIKLKHIIFGFLNEELTDLEYCISVVAYYVYKVWLIYSLNNDLEMYKQCDIIFKVKNEIYWKCEILQQLNKHSCFEMLNKIYLNL